MQKKALTGEVSTQNDKAVVILYSEISVFIFKHKGTLSRPISFLLNSSQISPPLLEAVVIFIVLSTISRRMQYNEGLLLETQIL